MIRVQAKPEYPEFDRQVRQRGQAFLNTNPNPSSAQFRKHNYWSAALSEMHAAYDRLCAYTTRELVQTGSVDHFKPKSKYSYLAYEWENYRLARQTINSRKGESEDVVDPFEVCEGWFTLELPSCLIKPGQGIGKEMRAAVNATINVLGLNRDERLVEERCRLLINLADGNITLNYLDSHYPFLSSEVCRQEAYGSLKEIFSRKTGVAQNDTNGAA